MAFGFLGSAHGRGEPAQASQVQRSVGIGKRAAIRECHGFDARACDEAASAA